jgi:5-methylcytosine-specific restriction endonuclease McrA
MPGKWTENQLVEAVEKSTCLIECIKLLGVSVGGSNNRSIRRRIKKLGISIAHWIDRRTIKGKKKYIPKKPLSEVLIENSTYSSHALRDRLIKDQLIDYKCAICGMINEWCGSQLSLQMDHINGINNDNRLENLRFLCPNCHSQTSTFGGRKLKGIKLKAEEEYIRYNCQDCGKLLQYYPSNNVKRCIDCHKSRIKAYDWIKLPSDQELYNDIISSNISLVAEKLDVNYNTLVNILEDKNMLDKIRNDPNYDPRAKLEWEIDGIDLLNMINKSSLTKVSKMIGINRGTIVKRLKKLLLYDQVIKNTGGRRKVK